ncbi:MAG: methyl-accepting chemotaxis protein [Defluviitaleaceae bacterium]|nr:methyl-accepting chemotaxis protein [Defluviitaleaceae bacterium]
MSIINNMSVKGKLTLVVVCGLIAFAAILIAGLFGLGYIFVIIAVIGIILWLIITVLVATSLTTDLRRISTATFELAKGNLHIELNAGGENDIAQLEESVASIARNLKSLTDNMSDVQKKQMSGDADATINNRLFQGTYHTMAMQFNTAVQSSGEQNDQIVKALAALNSGVFALDIPDFTGKAAEISGGIKSLASSLDHLSGDLGQMLSAAANGNISGRVNVATYNGNWTEIAKSLNNLFDAIAEPISETLTVMDAISVGDFSKTINGMYKGDFAAIKTGINRTVTNMSKFVEEITNVLNEIANNNLNVYLKGEFTGDFAVIKDALEKIISQFNEVIESIHSVAEQVAVGSKTISDSSMTVAEGASMQAVTVDHLTGTIMEVDEKTAQNAESAARAEILSTQSQENAAKGNAEMQNMLDAMEGIKTSSSNISSIIQVISDIAFQTSMLALNAAVEAARAGDHGKGFAVVAEEVRNLASSSDRAAKETTTLIEESIEKVEKGTEIAISTAQALEQIVNDTDEVSSIISGIASESHKQSEAINQVNIGTGQIAEVIQQNSSTSQETAAAAEELSGQSETLRDMISVFQLRGKSRPTGVSRAATVAAAAKTGGSASSSSSSTSSRSSASSPPEPPKPRPRVSSQNTTDMVVSMSTAKASMTSAISQAKEPPKSDTSSAKPTLPPATGNTVDLAAAYMAESQKNVAKSPAVDDTPRSAPPSKPAPKPAPAPAPREFTPAQPTAEGQSGGSHAVQAPSAQHVYGKSDYGKY